MARILDLETTCALCGDQLKPNEAASYFVCWDCQSHLSIRYDIEKLRMAHYRYWLFIAKFYPDWALKTYPIGHAIFQYIERVRAGINYAHELP